MDEIKSDTLEIWACNNINELGQITSYSQGNYNTAMDFDLFGVLDEITTGSIFNIKFGFSDAGNLEWREDVLTNQKEVFTYDDLNRLTKIIYFLITEVKGV